VIMTSSMVLMKRTQIQLDEQTYVLLRREAYWRACSVSAVVREAAFNEDFIREGFQLFPVKASL